LIEEHIERVVSMKRKLIGIVASLCTITVVVSLFMTHRWINKNEDTLNQANSDGPVPISIITMYSGRTMKDNNPVWEEIERKTNTKLNVQLVPASGVEYYNKINLLVASASLPDIVKIGGYDYFNYLPQGVFLELNSYIDKYGNNMKKSIPKEAWDKIAVEGGKYYAIPSYNYAGKHINVVRQDWLDNLSIKTPVNLNEYLEMLRKFTFNDPDKNGKNDTYGLGTVSTGTYAFGATFMPIFGAFGMQTEYYTVKENKMYANMISKEYKEAIAYCKSLFDEKVVDPEMFVLKSEIALEKVVQGKIGTFLSWWSVPELTLMLQYKMDKVSPGSKLAVIPPIQGKDGYSGMKAASLISGTVSISKNCKNPEAVIKFLDYLTGDEGSKLAYLGIKDIHYTEKQGKLESRTDEGKKAQSESWLDSLSQLIQRTDLVYESNKIDNPKSYEYAAIAMNSKLYSNAVEGMTNTAFQTYGSDLKKYEEEWFIKFVSGKEPLSKWDDYVKGWKTKGGQEVLDSFVKQYNRLKGANVIVGN
jgi:putative aldouronate transport system substrate-binding protein